MSVDQTEELLTVKEAAAILKVSTMTITRWLRQGRLQAYHVGPRVIRIRRADLEGLLRPTTAEEAIPPLTSKETARQAATLERAGLLRARILQRRGGRPLPSSAELMARDRDQRADHR